MTQHHSEPRLSFRLPLDAARLSRARERLRDYLHEQRLDGTVVDEIVLSVEEAMTNAVRHSGTEHDLEIDLRLEGDELIARVRDHGRGFDVADFDRDRLPDLLSTGGRGLYLMAHLMDDLELRRDEGIEVVMRKRGLRREQAPPAVNRAVIEHATLKGDTYAGARQRALVEEMTEGFATLDWEYRITYGNERALAFFGLQPADVLGRSFWEMFPATRTMPIGEAVRRAMEMGRSAIEEYVSPKVGRWVEARVYPTGSGLSIYLRDIDERKRRELERDRYLSALVAAQEAMREAERLSEASLAIDAALHSSLRSGEIIQSALSEGAKAIGAETAAVMLHEDELDQLRVAYVHAFPQEKIGTLVPEADDAHGVLAMRTRQTVAIDDARTDPRVVRGFLEEWGIRSVICAPLLILGRPIGVAYFNYHAAPHAFSTPEKDFVTRLASSMSLALENAGLYEAQKLELRHTRLLKDMAAAAASTFDLDALCKLTFDVLREQTDAKLAGVYQLEPKRAVLRHLASFGYPEELLPDLQTLTVDRATNVGRVILDELPYMTDDQVVEQPADSAARIEAGGFGDDRWIVIPLRAGEVTVGVFTVLFAGKRRFREDEVELYQAVAELLSNAIDKARLHEAQRRTALTLQESLIHPLPEVPGLELAALSLPANQPELIGGDFADAFVAVDGHVVVMIGDVAGKGVRAAGLTERVRSTMRAFAAVDSSPSYILRKTSELHLQGDDVQPHVTAFVCAVDVRSGRMSAASAGHPPPVVLSPSVCELLEMPFGPPLGTFASDYVPTHLTLPDDACVLLYTDGLTEARRAGEMLGERRLVEALCAFPRRRAEEVAHEAVEVALQFTDKLRDDLQVLAFRLTGVDPA